MQQKTEKMEWKQEKYQINKKKFKIMSGLDRIAKSKYFQIVIRSINKLFWRRRKWSHKFTIKQDQMPKQWLNMSNVDFNCSLMFHISFIKFHSFELANDISLSLLLSFQRLCHINKYIDILLIVVMSIEFFCFVCFTTLYYARTHKHLIQTEY